MKDSDNPQRHLVLLVSLLVIFVVSPFVVPYYYGPTILNVIAAAVLLSATYAVSRRRSFFIFALFFSIFSIGMTFWLAAAPTHWLVVISHGSLVILIIFFAIVGQFYLVALVGRLVGLHIVHGNPERQSE